MERIFMLAQKEDHAKELIIQKYLSYAETQKDFNMPEANITIDENGSNIKVYIDIVYKDISYHFESMKPEYAETINQQLDSQPAVRAKYADGGIRSLEQTTTRVNTLSTRFSNRKDKLYLYSAFIVSDSDTGDLLGLNGIGGSDYDQKYTEMFYYNTVASWSHRSLVSQEIAQEYDLKTGCKKPEKKQYSGVATTEVVTMYQYANKLKKLGYKIKDEDLEGINMTARTDNPGSWKAAAKIGMEVYDVDSNPKYGPELRYQLKKKIT